MQGLTLKPNRHAGNAGQAAIIERFAGGLESPVLGRLGPLEVRLASDESEVAAAQSIRYRVFFEEMGATPPGQARPGRRDTDRFDAICDHLLVVDTELAGPARERVVGTYRLLPQDSATAAGGFYSQDEFDLDSLLMKHPDRRFLELGRSCVMPAYRSKRTIELLWQGIWAYCRRNRIDVMTGCASFPGTIPHAHAEPLSFLAHFRQADGPWYVRARQSRYVSMDLMPREALNAKSALSAMPPLMKGYLRLGALFADGCVVDRDFGTTDVLVVLPVEAISERYIAYYGAEAERFQTCVRSGGSASG